MMVESSKRALAEHEAGKQDAETVLTSPQACAFLGVCKQTLWHWRKTERLPSRMIGGRVFFLKSDLKAALAAAPNTKGRRGQKGGTV